MNPDQWICVERGFSWLYETGVAVYAKAMPKFVICSNPVECGYGRCGMALLREHASSDIQGQDNGPTPPLDPLVSSLEGTVISSGSDTIAGCVLVVAVSGKMAAHY